MILYLLEPEVSGEHGEKLSVVSKEIHKKKGFQEMFCSYIMNLMVGWEINF